MNNPSDCVVTIIDNGLFCDFARTLAPAFKEAYYWTPWQNAFPGSNSLLPGAGFDEMKRIRWKWPAIKKSDLVIVLDVYWGDEQEHLVEDGKLVWGSRTAESLELDRLGAKDLMREYGVLPSPGKGITGMDDLREYLKEHPNTFVKCNAMRNDFETFKSESYELVQPKLDEIAFKMGAKQKIALFVVEPDISPAVEWGIDAFTVDGMWPKRTFSGLEIKDAGFVGRVMEWDEIPQYLRDGNEKLSPWFKDKQYRGFISNEQRILKDRTSYQIDWCCRLPSPPNEIQQVIMSNWPEVILAGAQGEMIDPEPAYKYGCCAMMHSSWADKGWQPIEMPEEVKPFVKLRNHAVLDGMDYAVPQSCGLPEIGAIVGVGNTLDEAIEHCKENSEKVKGYYLEVRTESLATALEEREKAEELGIEI